MTKLNDIDHFVVLMLENRSFDNVLGRLYPKSAAFDGVDGSETSKQRNGKVYTLREIPDELSVANLSVPNPDPGELWSDINLQIFGSRQVGSVGECTPPKPDAVADMSGFIDSYTDLNGDPSRGGYDPQSIMSCYNPMRHVPALAQLAKAFAVCDCWFASAPCQTWPNRFFLHTGTAAGYENNQTGNVLNFNMPTIFGAFDNAHQRDGWAIYHHDVPQTLTLSQLRGRLQNFHLFDKFLHQAANGTLPHYSFIEPRYYADVSLLPPRINLPNDQHPPHLMTFGDELVASIYKALRSNVEAWKRTMLIIIYDEHGGCYDHVPPGKAAPPGKVQGDNPLPRFLFDRYGVRVPAVIASPYIVPGTVLRPSDDYPRDGVTPFDHTSVIRTLRERFDLGAPLTARDAAAPTLERVLGLDEPTNLGPGPDDVKPLSYDPGFLYKMKALREPWNDFQQSLHSVARKLPPADHGRANLFLDRHKTTTNPDEDDNVRNGATAMWARLKYVALQKLGLRK
jgi:phospholipase C